MDERYQIDEFINRSENLSKTLGKEEAYQLITAEIDTFHDQYLSDAIGALNFICYEKVLDWIEANISRTGNINLNWGHLAASSNFSWNRAEKWLSGGRPLSLVALDALVFCTTKGERLNQSLWMRQLNPRIAHSPDSATIGNRLQEYLQTDRVPRTRKAVDRIIANLFD